jgi:hypothetical protein
MSTGSACECRGTNNFCSYCQPERTLTHVVNDGEKLKGRIKYLEKVMRAEAALILQERFSIDDEAQVERFRLSACRLVDAVKYK